MLRLFRREVDVWISAGAFTTEKPPLMAICTLLPAMDDVGSDDIVICGSLRRLYTARVG